MRRIFILVLLLTAAALAWGADYYVSKSGADSNPGTEAQPWKTIQKAANTLTAGDTVYIKAGAYNERVVIKNSGGPGNYITYTAYPGDTVTIDGSGITLPAWWGGLLDISGRNYIRISGLRIKNAGPDDNNCGILVDGCNDIVIENNYTYNTTSSGIGVWNSSHVIIDNNEVEKACNDGEQECLTVAVTGNFEIRNNHVHHGGPGSMGGEGIDAKDGCRNGKIYNNHVHHLNRLGIYVDAWDKHTYNIDVYNNIVHDCVGADGFTLASEAGGLLENVIIYNNIAYNNGVCGLTISRNGDAANHPIHNLTIINNTFYNNGAGSWGGGIAVDNPDVRTTVIRNNILSQNLSFQMEVETDVGMSHLTVDHNLIHGYRNYDEEIKGTNPVEGDPLFVNTAAPDFHLQATSPAIDAGSSIGAPSDDYDGVSRPQGSGVDIGAYEHPSGNGGGDAEISLDPTSLHITVIAGAVEPLSRTFTISNSGEGTLDWSLSSNQSWLTVSPASGGGSGMPVIAVDPSNLNVGSYSGAVTVISTNASNSPQTVAVHVTAKNAAQDQLPFGVFETPQTGAVIMSSVPVTGWALDDTEVANVKIYRGPVTGEGGSDVYIGDALFVDGARTDIEVLYPDYPNNSRAGWGYMMLTHSLPNGGNGTFTFSATATDGSGQSVTLGSISVTCNNADAVKPFGAIDNPGPGTTVSGSNYRNSGWVLTPLPNTVPTDGSTLYVFVDGVNLGHPVYNVYRADIAAAFPGYANSNGAHGYFDIDTATYENGLHTIAWSARDDAGNEDGIGSRYFNILNSNPSTDNAGGRGKGVRSQESGDRGERMGGRGKTLVIRELERVVVPLVSKTAAGVRRIVPLTKLPVGATLDGENGIFYWQPGAGFLGDYHLDFHIITRDGKRLLKRITVKITPKFPVKK